MLQAITIAHRKVHKGREEKTAKQKSKEIAYGDGEPKFPCLALCHSNKKQKKNLSFFFFLLLCLLIHIKKKKKIRKFHVAITKNQMKSSNAFAHTKQTPPPQGQVQVSCHNNKTLEEKPNLPQGHIHSSHCKHKNKVSKVCEWVCFVLWLNSGEIQKIMK